MKCILFGAVVAATVAGARAGMPDNYQLPTDWLVDATPFPARIERDEQAGEIFLTNGLIRRVIRLRPNGATVRFDNLMNGESIIRAVRPEAVVTIDGTAYPVGGLAGQPDHAYLTDSWLARLTIIPGAMQLKNVATGEPEARLTWKRTRHHAAGAQWPPKGVAIRLDYAVPDAAGTDKRPPADLSNVLVSVHYELYDGIPLISKWLTVQNSGERPVTVDRFRAEDLAVVEYGNPVEMRDGVLLGRPQVVHVETDMAFGGFTYQNANRHTVHWQTDPDYRTQVNYLRQNPCHLVVEPTIGPAVTIEPGSSFETFHVFELVRDGTDRERNGLAVRRMYRTIAPWVTENPLMMHMRIARPDAVRGAIDQCAEVGFEMLILSFGSGFQAENDQPDYLRQWKEIADYAHSKGVQIGCYSLLSSRQVDQASMIVSPEGQAPTHGRCPALTSRWGQEYFRKLRHLFESTGFDCLEHDGSYPGDVDVTPRPPLQKGAQDSRWVQWRIISDFYRRLRGRGVYLNVPDYYFLSGSTKCGMGYRETNWSLPRAQQLIHTRQNIYDGTWTKTPSMGWMFVPLTVYHGGGAAATIEPLDEHLAHYESMLTSNLAFGVQACYRGPRLYDTERTRAMVKERVAWFKKHRPILESDLIHGRRADGWDLDWMVHVNPRLRERGLLAVFNPTDHAITRTIRVPLYYTGLAGQAQVSREGGSPTIQPLDAHSRIDVRATVPAGSYTWYTFAAAR